MTASPRSRAGLLIVLVAAQSCAPATEPQLTDTERASIATAVEAQVERFAEGASQRDPQIQASAMAPDVEIVDFSRLTESRDANVAWATELFSNFASFSFTWYEISVEVLGPDASVATAIGSVRRQHVDGRIQEADRSVFFTGLYRASDGQWLLTRGHLSGAFSTVQP